MGKKRYLSQLRRGWKWDSDPKTGEPRDDWAKYAEEKPEESIPRPGEMVLEYDNGIPRLKIGDGVTPFASLSYMSVDSFILSKHASVHLSTNWIKDSDDRYYQVVTVQNAIVTPSSKVDLQVSPEDLTIFHEKDLAFVAENEDGTVRVYCVGQVPLNEYDLQCTVTEVASMSKKIIGNTTATPNPRPNYNQMDPSKADYIVGRENILSADNLASATEEAIRQAKENGELDYTLTDSDKQDIVDLVLEDLPTWEGGSY